MPAMTGGTAAHDTSNEPAGSRRAPVFVLLASLTTVAALVGVAWWMTGPAPKPADAGVQGTPPPLVLPSGTAKDSGLARAAASLATGDLVAARQRFVDVVASSPDDVAAQAGLILSGWTSVGPRAVERDLAQLVREYPESSVAVVHLGLVQGALRDTRPARASLRSGVELGRAEGDATGLRLARLADDLLHPRAFSGYVPVLVEESEVGVADRRTVHRLLAAVARDDRVAAARLGTALARSGVGLVQVAGAAAQFDKDDPAATAARLDAVVARRGGDRTVADRARLEAALATLWDGGDRSAGCARLRTVTAPSADAATRRIAAPIARELCT